MDVVGLVPRNLKISLRNTDETVMPIPPHPKCARSLVGVHARARTERGIGVVEITVVLVIIAILMAIVTLSFRGSKRATYYRAAVASASIYGEAVEAYMADNAQVAPVIGKVEPGDTQAVWPDDAKQVIAGPRDRLLVMSPQDPRWRPYMTKGAPEPVQTGLVAFGPLSPDDQLSSIRSRHPQARAYISYSVDDGNASIYRIKVTTLDLDSEEPMRCTITNAAELDEGWKRC